MRAIVWMFAVILSAVPSLAIAQAQEQRVLTVGGTFLDTVDGSWINIEPQFARKPTAEQLKSALGGHLPEDFGFAFSCWVQPAGSLHDCRSTMTAPEGLDGATLAHALAPLMRLSPASAHVAAAKEYRLSVHVALNTISGSGMNRACYPPFCVAGFPPPPAPPPEARDPLIRTAIEKAEACFSQAWRRSGDLQTTAEKAVKDNQAQPPPDSVRAAVLDYVRSRLELKQCIGRLEDVSHSVPAFGDDQKAIERSIQSMRSNYALQTPREVSVLVGVLDKQAGEAEMDLPVP